MTPDQRANLADNLIAVLLDEAANIWPTITIETARKILKSIETRRNGNLALYLRARFIALIESADIIKPKPVAPPARLLPPSHLCGGNNCEECGGPGALHARTCSCQE